MRERDALAQVAFAEIRRGGAHTEALTGHIHRVRAVSQREAQLFQIARGRKQFRCVHHCAASVFALAASACAAFDTAILFWCVS